MKFLFFKKIDWLLFLCTLPLLSAGLVTMFSFTDSHAFFNKQLIFILIGIIIFFITSTIDTQSLKKSNIVFLLYVFFLFLLLILFVLGKTTNGAQSWFSFGSFSFQPSDLMKVLLILVCAKYFSRRHVEIKRPKLVLISALYMFLPFLLIFLQPDFGSAIILFCIWFGMTLFSGLSKKHIFILIGVGLTVFLILWGFIFKPYQKDRVMNFINPTLDITGSGYNARQSVIAVGSGRVFGKNIGYGTQSRLQYLPENQTDFIFAAFSEEWGFIGSLFIVIFFLLVLFRIGYIAFFSSSNFEILISLGIGVFILSHVIINIGMNIGIMPITGITLPFMSYGGSHIIAEFFALGLLSSIHRNKRATHRENLTHEFLGLE